MEEIDDKYLNIDKKTPAIIDNAKKFVKGKMFNDTDVDFNIGDIINHTDGD